MKLRSKAHLTVRRLVVNCSVAGRLQDERLEVIKKMLQQREADHAALNDKRMEQLWYVAFLTLVY